MTGSVTALPPAARARSRVRAYLRLLRVGPMIDLAYRFNALTNVAFLVMRIYLYYALWSAIYHPGQVVAGMDVRQAITYSVLAALQSWAPAPTADTIQSRVNDGSIVFLFMRPFPVLRYFFVQRLGSAFYALAWLVVGGTIAWIAGIIMPPASATLLGVYLISVVLGQVVRYYLQVLFDLSAFWTIRTTGLAMLYGFMISLLGGSMVPIWFFPGWLQHVALWLPFQAFANTPLSLYVGRLPFSGALGDLSLQVFWCLVLAGLARLIFLAAERRVVIQGG